MKIERGIMKKSLFVLALVLTLAGCSKSVSSSAKHLMPPTSVVTTTQPLASTTSTRPLVATTTIAMVPCCDPYTGGVCGPDGLCPRTVTSCVKGPVSDGFWTCTGKTPPDSILNSSPSAPTTTTTTAPPTSTQGTIGPTSGSVEWICSDGSGSGGKGGAAIAAVQDGQGNWQCPSDLFGNLWSVEVGGAFYCTTDNANGNDVGGPPYYAPTIGNFTVNGEPGSYYGVYCTEPGEDALDATP
jgi:hypothetical protein